MHRSTAKTVPNEISDGKVGIQRQIRADKSEAARDPDVHRVGVASHQPFRTAFRLAIGAMNVGEGGRAGVRLGNVLAVGGLAAIDRTGTGKKVAPRARADGQRQGLFGSADDIPVRCLWIGMGRRRSLGFQPLR